MLDHIVGWAAGGLVGAGLIAALLYYTLDSGTLVAIGLRF